MKISSVLLQIAYLYFLDIICCLKSGSRALGTQALATIKKSELLFSVLASLMLRLFLVYACLMYVNSRETYLSNLFDLRLLNNQRCIDLCFFIQCLYFGCVFRKL